VNFAEILPEEELKELKEMLTRIKVRMENLIRSLNL